jgi:hypothetical protein
MSTVLTPETIEFAVKAITAIGAPFATYKVFMEVLAARRSRRIDDLKVTKELVEQVNGNSHALLVEKAYAALTGDQSLSAEQVKHLLSLPSPGRAIAEFTAGRDFLEVFEATAISTTRIRFREKYASSQSRKFYEYWHGFWYLAQAMGCLAILSTPTSFFGKNEQQSIAIATTLFISLAILALFSVNSRATLLRAERFMKSIQPPATP